MATTSERLMRLLFPDCVRDLEQRADQRFARLVANADPFEALMRHYRGVFSEEYEHPESKLDEKSKLAMAMWAWKTEEDPCFKYLVDWIQNTEGNAAIKRGNPTPETILYSRAILSSMILLKREIGRLSAQYKELLAKKDDEFNSFQNE